MKTYEEYLMDNNFTICEILEKTHSPDGKKGNMLYRLKQAIKQIQIDTYNKAIDDAAKNATASEFWDSEQESHLVVNKQSILKLKK